MAYRPVKLDFFLKKNCKKIFPKNAYYLIWTKPYNYKIHWVHKKKINISNLDFCKKINWKYLSEPIYVVGLWLDKKLIYKDYTVEVNGELLYSPSRNVSWLKSHLQKCIRRSQVQPAIQTAYHLMGLNMKEFSERKKLKFIIK